MTDSTRNADFLDRVAGEIQNSELDDDVVTAATDRVWDAIHTEFSVDTPLRSCADFQALLPALVADELPEGKAILVGDHTRECVPCRRVLLELRGGGDKVSVPSAPIRQNRVMPTWLKIAAAVVFMVGAGSMAWMTGGNLLAEKNLSAQIASIDGSLQLVTGQATVDLAEGDTIRAKQRIRTSKETGAFIRLADGSMVEMAPRSELALRGSRRGTTIELGHGNIIVHAAKQGRGRLGVTTNECEVAVKGTIFAVNHGLKGSRVSVIEGEVEVRQGGTESMLLPGDQITTDERLKTVAIEDTISWSVNAEEHRRLLAELTQLQYEVAEAVDIAAPRTSTRLLDLGPADTVVYVAMPNLTEGLGAARQVFSSRLAESDVLRDWWQREIVDKNIDTQIEESLDQLQFLGDAVGDEVVVILGASGLAGEGAPLFLAELEDPRGFRSLLEEHLASEPEAARFIQLLADPDEPVGEETELLIWVTDDLVVAARTADLIQGVAARLDGSAQNNFVGTELHKRLGERYASGVEWLFGLDLQSIFVEATGNTNPEDVAMMERLGLFDASTMVFERHRDEIGSKIDADIRFNGPRRGVAAWLAEPAPLTTLDFVSQDAYLVSAVAAKDGVELFDELLGMVSTVGPEALSELESFESEIGIDLRDDLAVAIGGEGTFAVDGPVLPLPTWKLIVEIYDPATLEHAISEVIQRANTELAENGAESISVEVQTADGRTLTTLRHPSSPIAFTYTLTDGFLVAGSSRWAVENAIAVQRSGMGLASSAAFRELLPSNGFTDCSALVYRNLSPIIGVLPQGAMGSQLGEYETLLKESAAPGLFCAYGMDDRILIAGSGPSLVGLAPLLGLQSLMDFDGIVEDGSDELSSAE
jgi:hypothetical protein